MREVGSFPAFFVPTQIAWEQYCRALRAVEIGTPVDQSEHELPRADDIRIGDLAPVIIASGNVVRLEQMRFGFPPARPKGPPVFNFRSEGRRFADSKRCLIPASAFFEFTGKNIPRRSIGSRSTMRRSWRSLDFGGLLKTMSIQPSRC